MKNVQIIIFFVATLTACQSGKAGITNDNFNGTSTQVSDTKGGNARTMASATRQTGLRLLQISLEEGKSNPMLSPVSLLQVLSMLQVGARENTARQLADHAQVPTGSAAQDWQALSAELQRSISPYNGAAAVWLDRGFTPEAAYEATIRQHFGAAINTLPLSQEPLIASRDINKWVGDATHGQILQLIAPDMLNPLTRLVITDALYFKEKFKVAFDPKNTGPGIFKAPDGKTVEVPFMRMSGSFPTFRANGATWLEMPYEGDYTLLFMLPDEEGGNELQALTPEDLEAALAQAASREVRVEIPKFSIAADWNMQEYLTKLGVSDLFVSGKADLSGISSSQPLHVSVMVQKVAVEMSEEGTEAAAATGAVVNTRSMPRLLRFVADRPFGFYILHKPTGALLFAGVVHNPAGN